MAPSASTGRVRGNDGKQQNGGEVSARRASWPPRAPERHQRRRAGRFDKPKSQHGCAFVPSYESVRDARLLRNCSIGTDAAHERRNGEKGDDSEDDEGAAPKVFIASREGGNEQPHSHEESNDRHVVEQQVEVIEVHVPLPYRM